MKARQEAAERRRLEVQKAKRQKSEARGDNQVFENQISISLSGEAEVKVPRTAVEAGESASAGGGRKVRAKENFRNQDIRKPLF